MHDGQSGQIQIILKRRTHLVIGQRFLFKITHISPAHHHALGQENSSVNITYYYINLTKLILSLTEVMIACVLLGIVWYFVCWTGHRRALSIKITL